MRSGKRVLVLLVSLAIPIAITMTSQSNSEELADQDMIAHGKYLVMTGGCNDCHTPKVLTDNGPALDQTRLLAGHRSDEPVPDIPGSEVIGPDKWGAVTNMSLTAWAGPWGVSFASNLTPDKISGLGMWNEDTFIKTIRNGKHMGTGRQILPPMPLEAVRSYTDDDLRAIFAFLQTLKPIENVVPQPKPPASH